MEIKKEDVEKGMFENITKSLDLTQNPENIWQIQRPNNKEATYTRKDGLKIIDNGYSWNITSPVEYKFENYMYRDKILLMIRNLSDYFIQLEKKRIEQEKLQKLSSFFELDVKELRMKKLEKIENKSDEY